LNGSTCDHPHHSSHDHRRPRFRCRLPLRDGVDVRASGYDRATNDWYREPGWVVDALLNVESFHGLSHDPACGGGTIPKTMQARGFECSGSDIEDRGFGFTGLDFFKSSLSVGNIVSNPPYNVLQEWVDHSLRCASHKVAVIARLAFLESSKRKSWFESRPLARVWVSSKRVSMPPGGTDIKASGGSIAYAWFVFEHGHAGRPELGFL
jgi:hypothetical protein